MVYPAGNVKTAREEIARFDLPAFLFDWKFISSRLKPKPFISMLDIYEFNLGPLKKSFNVFAIAVITISVISCLGTFLLPIMPEFLAFYSKYFWFFFIAFFVFNFAFEGKSKQGFSKLAETEDFQEQVTIYSAFYKRKLVINAVSVIVTCFILFLSHKKLFLIILAIQVVLLPAFYPRPEKISKALKNDEILFI